ncbi:MAG: replication initiation protein RepC [Phyllobacterium sp.]
MRQRWEVVRQHKRRSADPHRANEEPARKLSTPPIALDVVLRACPQIRNYARDGIQDWHDLLQTAGLVRSMLGVSPDAWERAREAMGDFNASITIAAILERVADIRSPGGYLRALTDRAEVAQYSVIPVIKALMGEERA